MCSEDQRRWHQSALYMFLHGLVGLVGRWSHITITVQGQLDQSKDPGIHFSDDPGQL